MRNLLWIGMLFLTAPAAADAQAGKPMLELHVSGEVQIAPDGHVSDYVLASDLAKPVASLVEKNVRGWIFEPVLINGRAVVAKTAVNMAIKAEPVDESNYRLRIVDVHFGGATLSKAHMYPPKYPAQAIRAGVGGKVVLALRLDENGNVAEAVPYQTNLDVRTRTEKEAELYRQILEKASLDAAKRWHYDLTEKYDGKPIRSSVLVPVAYSLDSRGAKDGHWKSYLPGPVHDIPWKHDGQVAAKADAASIPDGSALSLDSNFKLKSDVIGKTL
ncbi:MAG: energy transducer TonB [Proteobacteria bacterium]|nr:energy transducer TonB [Pseudomonadota bacterium]